MPFSRNETPLPLLSSTPPNSLEAMVGASGKSPE